ARRTVRCRLVPNTERPWERQDFHHPDLLLWVDAHRGELIWANLVLIRAWWVADHPPWTERTLGSYGEWARVIGGILAYAGIPGFLANVQEFYELADTETAVWQGFVE